jgi:hypothetical protein
MEDKTLDQKFGTILNDPQLHVDFLDWYKEKTAIKTPLSFWQKALPIAFAVCLFSLAVGFIFYIRRDRVDQYVFKSGSTPEYLTVVWVNQDIAKCWFDPITITDSLKNARRIEAERILNTVK